MSNDIPQIIKFAGPISGIILLLKLIDPTTEIIEGVPLTWIGIALLAATLYYLYQDTTKTHPINKINEDLYYDHPKTYEEERFKTQKYEPGMEPKPNFDNSPPKKKESDIFSGFSGR